jgi:hypothetical protein
MTTALRTIASLILLILVISPRCFAAGQSQTPPPPKTQTQSASQPQPPAQPPAATQTSDATPAEDSLAEASRKAKAKKEKLARGKVLTDDDLSGIRGNGVSVVGDGTSGGSGSKSADGSPALGEASESGAHDEQYWRGKSRDLLDQISATDQEIAKTQEEIKKYGNVGFDPSTGLKKNVIYVDDRQTKVKKLEERKQDLQRQLEQLEDEGRKEGAPPAWFR